MGAEKLTLEEILDQAAEIRDPVERSAYLDKVCQGDPALRSEVESLLQAHEEAGDFLEAPVFDADVTLDNAPVKEGPGMEQKGFFSRIFEISWPILPQKIA